MKSIRAFPLLVLVAALCVIAAGLPFQASAAPKPKPTSSPKPSTSPKPSPTFTGSTHVAPYPDVRIIKLCDRYADVTLQEQCDPYSGADPVTGDVFTFDRVSSPQFGRLPMPSTNRAWSRSEVQAVASITSPVASLPVEVRFHVAEAEATIEGIRPMDNVNTDTSSAAGGLLLDVAGSALVSRTLVDTYPDTSVEAAFAGEVVLRTELTNVPVGPLNIFAGAASRATVREADAATSTVTIDAIVTSIVVGTAPAPSPSPSPTATPGPATTYTAPFDATGITYNGRKEMLPGRSGSIEGATTVDTGTGEVTASLDAVGFKANCTPSLCYGSTDYGGTHGGSSTFQFRHHVPRSSPLTVTAVWHVDSATAFHPQPCVFNCGWHAAKAVLSVAPADAPWGGDWDSAEILPFATTEVVTVSDRTITTSVTLPAVEGDVTIETYVGSVVRASLGFGKLDLTARLVSLTVR